MVGTDDRGWLCGTDEAAGLHNEVEYVEANNNVVLEIGQTIGFECCLTRDGKGTQFSNYSPLTKCWMCEVGARLQPHDPDGPLGCFLKSSAVN